MYPRRPPSHLISSPRFPWRVWRESRRAQVSLLLRVRFPVGNIGPWRPPLVPLTLRFPASCPCPVSDEGWLRKGCVCQMKKEASAIMRCANQHAPWSPSGLLRVVLLWRAVFLCLLSVDLSHALSDFPAGW